MGLACLKLAVAYVALVSFGVHMTLLPLLRGHIGIAWDLVDPGAS